MNILIRNLHRAVKERELMEMFLKFGTIKSFNIVIDQKTGVSKGFGFVDMPEQSEAEAAIKALDGKFVRGERLRVKNSIKPSQTPKEYKPEGGWKKLSLTRGMKGVHKERSSTGRPGRRFTETPAGRSSGRPSERSNERPAGRPAERSIERSTGRPAGRFTEKTAARSTARPTERRTGRATEKSTQRPGVRPTERSNKRSTGRPAGRPKR